MRPKKKILCVSSDEQQLSILKVTLEIWGYRVFTAASAAEAIEIFATLEFELVVTDYALHAMNGAQLVERLRRTAPRVPVIMLGDAAALSELHLVGAMIVEKGCKPCALRECICVMSARRRGPRKHVVGDQLSVVSEKPVAA